MRVGKGHSNECNKAFFFWAGQTSSIIRTKWEQVDTGGLGR